MAPHKLYYGTAINSRAVLAEILIDETYLTGGGGITTVDSVLFIRKTSMDSILYKNEKNGGDLSKPNHFFNRLSWIEKRFNKFYYTLSDEDFE